MTNERTEIVIIGGGLVGCFAALFLARRKRSVVLLEKGAIGREASGLNFGNLRLQGRNPVEYPLSLAAHDIWENYEAITGEACGYIACGHAYVGFGDKDLAKIEQYAGEANAAGVTVDILDADGVRARWPGLSPIVTGATWSSRDGAADPERSTEPVARAASRAGADIRESMRVIDITRSGASLQVSTGSGTTIACDRVINAAGAWAGRLSAALGEPVPMFAAGPPIIMTEPVALLGLPSMLAIDGSIIFRQDADGCVVTSSFPRAPSDLEKGASPVTLDRIERDLARLATIVPSLAGVKARRAWSGVEGYLPDMLPVIGPSRTTPGVIHAFGLSGHGYQLSPAVGRVAAELAADGTSEFSIGAFGIERFAGAMPTDERIWKEFEPALVAHAKRQGAS